MKVYIVRGYSSFFYDTHWSAAAFTNQTKAEKYRDGLNKIVTRLEEESTDFNDEVFNKLLQDSILVYDPNAQVKDCVLGYSIENCELTIDTIMESIVQ